MSTIRQAPGAGGSRHSGPGDPQSTLRQLRRQVLGGRKLLLGDLTAEELAAAQDLIFKGEAEIVGAACRPFLAARLDRVVADS